MTAAVAVAGIGAVTLAPRAGHGPTTSTVQSPLSLALAAQTTTRSTFRVSWTVRRADGGSIRYEGAYDPLNDRGYTKALQSDGAKFHEQRRIGTTCYIQPAAGDRWIVDPHCASPGTLGTTANMLTDPDAVLRQLTAAGVATHAGHSGTLDRWTFRYPEPGNGPVVSGTATVDSSTQRVVTVELAEKAATTNSATFRFSDFGRPVTVTAPAH